jgi:phytoene synthase
MSHELSSIVRRVDEDRWLASRFAPSEARRRLNALYALNYEIARTADVVTQAALGDIRLAWWREGIAEVFDGKPARAHPALEAFAEVRDEVAWPRAVFDTLIDARGRELDGAVFADWPALDAHIGDTAGALMRIAAVACGAAADQALIARAARAWGYVGWARAQRPPPRGETQAAVLGKAQDACDALRGTRILAALFPALGYAALAPMFVRALQHGRRDTLVLARQVKLIAASASGRF